MRKDGLGKLYDRLTPEERFRLVIEAEVREDTGESRQLVGSAPRYTYRQADPAYTRRVRASHEITWAICLDLLPRLSRIQLVRAFSEALPLTYNACENEAISAYFDGHRDGSRRGWQAAGKTGEPPGWEEAWEEEDEEDPQIEEALNPVTTHIQGASKRFMGLLKDLELEIATEARVLWEAFSNFSREELGLEPKKLIKFWFEVALSEIDHLEALTEDVELDREKVEESESYIRDGWRKLVEG
jgi:hypothetical protein